MVRVVVIGMQYPRWLAVSPGERVTTGFEGLNQPVFCVSNVVEGAVGGPFYQSFNGLHPSAANSLTTGYASLTT